MLLLDGWRVVRDWLIPRERTICGRNLDVSPYVIDQRLLPEILLESWHELRSHSHYVSMTAGSRRVARATMFIHLYS